MQGEPTASDWRAAIGLVARAALPADVRARLEHGMRRAADAAGAWPVYMLEPLGDGALLVGHAETARRFLLPQRGLSGLAVVIAGLRNRQPDDDKGPAARRKAVQRLREWVAKEVPEAEPLHEALGAIEVSVSGVFYRRRSPIVIETGTLPLASVSRPST